MCSEREFRSTFQEIGLPHKKCRLLFSGMRHRVIWWISNTVVEEHLTIMKTEAAGYCEMLTPLYQNARSVIPEDCNRQSTVLRISRLTKILIT